MHVRGLHGKRRPEGVPTLRHNAAGPSTHHTENSTMLSPVRTLGREEGIGHRSGRVHTRARRCAIQVFAKAVTISGADLWKIRRMARRSRLLILNLHSVTPRRSSLEQPLTPELFDELLTWMNANFRIVTLAQVAASRRPADDRPCAVLSFDDGYRDFVEYAMPILARHGVRVNQNIVPECIEAQRPPWNVHLVQVLEQLPTERLEKFELPGAGPRLSAGRLGPARFGLEVSRYLKNRPRYERRELLSAISEQLPELMMPSPGAMMSVEEVRLVARDHELGLQSFSHDSMEFESDDFFRSDTKACLEWATACVGCTPRIYAFANGSYRQSQIEIASTYGFEHVLLVGERSTPWERHVRTRVTVFGTDACELRARLARAA